MRSISVLANQFEDFARELELVLDDAAVSELKPAKRLLGLLPWQVFRVKSIYVHEVFVNKLP
jgi:hypothetical protein